MPSGSHGQPPEPWKGDTTTQQSTLSSDMTLIMTQATTAFARNIGRPVSVDLTACSDFRALFRSRRFHARGLGHPRRHVESVELALRILDGYRLRDKEIRVERARFQLKGTYDPTKKPKKKKQASKDKERLKKKIEKTDFFRVDYAHFYRKCIVKRSLASVERGQQPAGVTILDAMHYLASAWSAATAATVEHCFNKCFGVRTDDTTEDVGDGAFADCDELNTAMETVGASGIAYSDYASVDDAVVISTMLSVDDIMAECTDTCARDEEVKEEVERIPQPTSSSAVAALDLLRRYVRTSDDGESHMALQVLEKRLVLVRPNKCRESQEHDSCEADSKPVLPIIPIRVQALLKEPTLFDWRPEKLRGMRDKHECTVVLKNMFDTKEFESDPTLILEYQKDLREECGQFGEVKKVVVYDRHPEGVATVTFKEPEEADACIGRMNGRWFAQRQLSAETWDGRTRYKIFETEEELEERLKKWDDFLEADDDEKAKSSSSDPSAVPSTSAPKREAEDSIEAENGASAQKRPKTTEEAD
ncbi:hypothetical protein HPB51_012582 [Rhipicephalus microplus]|uniref:RRM domain-containing protein n=1 Tax=Rhipicephalus microplus TaxID=6941 RepID=A0A9J6DGN5_RHIMP|nr:hypothetical protein HPB51_012582 [Rhipicephalus microplus]